MSLHGHLEEKNLTSKLFLLSAFEFMAFESRGKIYGHRDIVWNSFYSDPWNFKDNFGSFLLGRAGGGGVRGEQNKNESSFCLMRESHVLKNTFSLL